MRNRGVATTQSLNGSVGISWRNRIGFWMQRDRPNDVSRGQTTTSQSRRLVRKQEIKENKKEKWEMKNEKWQWEWSRMREQIVAALKCNRKVTGRLKSLRNRKWRERKKKKKKENYRHRQTVMGIPREFEGLCLIVLRYADSSEWSCPVLNP